MRILIINTYDRGGAANACLRLHEGLLLNDINSKVLLRNKQKDIRRTYEIESALKKPSFIEKLIRKIKATLKRLKLYNDKSYLKENFIRSRPLELEMFSFPNSNFDITSTELYRKADIINLHWVADFLDFNTFFKKNTKPVVWTLHDMNPFTGGEHYLETISGMNVSGFPVARKISDIEIDLSHKNLIFKQNAIKYATNLNIVAPSKWLCNAAKESTIFNNKVVHHIPYGVNEEVFRPRDKNTSRDILNLPKDKIIILFVADSITNHRKGYAYLQKALEFIRSDNIVLCAVGAKNSDLESINNIIELGPIYDEHLMSNVYSSADVFVIPSIMDNLPNTVLEALMCGTPIIGFPVGGILDMVEPGKNGLLAKSIDSKSLSETIEQFLSTIKNFNRIEIREDAKNKYALEIQANSYISLFNNILNTKKI